MKTSAKIACGVAVALAAAIASNSVHAATVDTRDAATPGPGTTFWVPAPGQELNSPYYRFADGDWGWQHGPVPTAGATQVELDISAFDVDFVSVAPPPGERDAIYGLDVATATLVQLQPVGFLVGANNAFAFTTFNLMLTPQLLDDVAVGLQVFMNIDINNHGWAVSLAKSVLTTDGADPGNPNPGQVPLPGALPLFVTGLGALGLLSWRKKRKAQAAA